MMGEGVTQHKLGTSCCRWAGTWRANLSEKTLKTIRRQTINNSNNSKAKQTQICFAFFYSVLFLLLNNER